MPTNEASSPTASEAASAPPGSPSAGEGFSLYSLLRRALFLLDAETAHERVFALLAFASEHPGALRLIRSLAAVDDPRLRVRAFGLDFPNPFGLAAGFDKDGRAAATWSALGFGSAELGSVTAIAQPGNPRPRLLRYPEARALINRMGFNNQGAATLAGRLAKARARPWWPDTPVGVNVGKSRTANLAAATDDYRLGLSAVWPVADYLVLNVSSPNTPGLRSLQEAGPLAELLALTRELKQELGHKPTLLKIAPDLGPAQLDEVVTLAERYGMDGLIATNTTVRRELLGADPGEEGGLSGAPLGPLAAEVLRALRARTALPLVAAGGIAGPHDAIARLEAGATLLQAYTGWIYQGPGLPRKLLRGLLRWLEQQGHGSLQAYLDRRDASHVPLPPTAPALTAATGPAQSAPS